MVHPESLPPSLPPHPREGQQAPLVPAPAPRQPPHPSPMQRAGGAAPAGGKACPPVSKNVGGVGRWDNGAGQARPSSEGGRRPQRDHPSSRRALSLPSHPAEGEKTLPPSLPQAGCRGRSPRRGYRGTPPVPKNVGGCGWDNRAGQARPSADGGRRPKQNHPSPSAGGLRSPRPLPPPIAKYERVCYDTPNEVGPRPASLSRSLPHT